MGSLEPGIVDQLKQVLANQQRELRRIRESKRDNSARLADLQAQEIEVLVGIQQTKKHLEAWGEQTEGDK